MKKLTVFLLSFAMCLAFAGCAAEPVETVPETAALPLQEIEITLDNWQEYFEQREAQRVRITETGSVYVRDFGYGIFLKEEYANRLAEADVSFDMQVNSVRYQVYGDLTTDNFIIREDTLHTEGEIVLTAEVEDLRGSTRILPDSDLHNAVAAFFTVEGEFGA